MATTSCTNVQSWYSNGAGSWTCNTIQTSTNSDNNRWYVGGDEASARTKFSFTTPSGASIGTVSKIIFKFYVDDGFYPNYTRAFLSTSSTSNSNTSNITNVLGTSYIYKDENKTTRFTGSASSGSGPYYFVFNGNFTPNTTYYLYIYMYTSEYGESTANINNNAADGWIRSRNTSSYVYIGAECQTATYTISYDANGGTGAPSSQTKTHGTALTLSSTTPTCESTYQKFSITGDGNGGTSKSIIASKVTSYTFAGWSTSPSGSVQYSAGSSFNLDQNTILYAVWSPSTSYSNNTIAALGSITRPIETLDSYEVVFDANGGSCGVTHAKTYLDRTYTFLGWGSSSSATTTLPSSTSYTSATIVYAIWASSDYIQPIYTPTPTREGYTFNGWNAYSTSSSGFFGDYTPSRNITLYATWKAKGLIYIDNGSSFDAYQIFVDNGTSWGQYTPYIDNGSNWDLYS